MASNGTAPVVIGVGASAGGVEALTTLVSRLPADLPAAVLIVLHISPSGTSVLDQILDRAGPLPVRVATEGEPAAAGAVYIAPPDRHLSVEDGRLHLGAGPRENGHRPSVDVLLRSLAALGERSVGVILSGTRDDGTRGLTRLKAAGGTALVQDPEEALYRGMIDSASRYVTIDGSLKLDALAHELSSLARTKSTMIPREDPQAAQEIQAIDGEKTRYTCPDCGGSLFRFQDGAATHYDCSVGHRYSPESLDGEQSDDVESALWAAARLLGDRTELLTEMAERANRNGHDRSAAGFRERAAEAGRAADVVRALLLSGSVPTGGGAGTPA